MFAFKGRAFTAQKESQYGAESDMQGLLLYKDGFCHVLFMNKGGLNRVMFMN